jgi:hypothetical protein
LFQETFAQMPAIAHTQIWRLNNWRATRDKPAFTDREYHTTGIGFWEAVIVSTV